MPTTQNPIVSIFFFQINFKRIFDLALQVIAIRQKIIL